MFQHVTLRHILWKIDKKHTEDVQMYASILRNCLCTIHDQRFVKEIFHIIYTEKKDSMHTKDFLWCLQDHSFRVSHLPENCSNRCTEFLSYIDASYTLFGEVITLINNDRANFEEKCFRPDIYRNKGDFLPYLAAIFLQIASEFGIELPEKDRELMERLAAERGQFICYQNPNEKFKELSASSANIGGDQSQRTEPSVPNEGEGMELGGDDNMEN